MRIESSHLSLGVKHNAESTDSRKEKVEVWVRPVPKAAPAQVTTPASTPTDVTDPTVALTPKQMRDLAIIEEMLSRLMNMPVKLRPLRIGPITSPEMPQTSAPAQQGESGMVGWGMRAEVTTSHSESESLAIAAAGTITFEDGSTMAVGMTAQYDRSFHTESTVRILAGDALKDPIVISLDGGPVRFNGQALKFDLDGNGVMSELLPSLEGGSAWLAYDRNGDNAISNGGELFGPKTGNGYRELAALDADGSGWVDEGDAAFAALRVVSYGADGQPQVSSLKDAGIGALSVDPVETPFRLTAADNSTLGQMAESGIVLREDGSATWSHRVDVKA